MVKGKESMVERVSNSKVLEVGKNRTTALVAVIALNNTIL